MRSFSLPRRGAQLEALSPAAARPGVNQLGRQARAGPLRGRGAGPPGAAAAAPEARLRDTRKIAPDNWCSGHVTAGGKATLGAHCVLTYGTVPCQRLAALGIAGSGHCADPGWALRDSARSGEHHREAGAVTAQPNTPRARKVYERPDVGEIGESPVRRHIVARNKAVGTHDTVTLAYSCFPSRLRVVLDIIPCILGGFGWNRSQL